MAKIMQIRSVSWALRAQGIISVSLTVIGVMLIPSRANSMICRPYDKGTLKCLSFWFLCLINITCILGYEVVLYTMSAATTALGYTEAQGAPTSAMVQVGYCLGRPLLGLLSDTFGVVTVNAISYLMACIFTLEMWIPAKNYATLIMFSLLDGLVIGTIFGTVVPMTAKLAGLRKLNVVFCMLWLFLGTASTFAEPAGASLTSVLSNGLLDINSLKNTQIFAGASFFASSMTAFSLIGYLKGRDVAQDKSHENLGEDLVGITVPFKDFISQTFTIGSKI